MPIVNTIILAGRMSLPLRGHRNLGSLELPFTETRIDVDSGNLRSLLQFKALNGDTVLGEHLANCWRNATSISWRSQNEIISCDQIQASILDRTRKAQFFTVIADETTDVSRVEQMSLCVRFFRKARCKRSSWASLTSSMLQQILWLPPSGRSWRSTDWISTTCLDRATTEPVACRAYETVYRQ